MIRFIYDIMGYYVSNRRDTIRYDIAIRRELVRYDIAIGIISIGRNIIQYDIAIGCDTIRYDIAVRRDTVRYDSVIQRDTMRYDTIWHDIKSKKDIEASGKIIFARGAHIKIWCHSRDQITNGNRWWIRIAEDLAKEKIRK